MKIVLGVVRPEMAMHFGSKKVELMLDVGAIHGQPTDWFGTVKNSPSLLVGLKLSM